MDTGSAPVASSRPPNQRLAVEHILPIVTPNDLAQVAIAERDGQSVRLADVAHVAKGTQGLVGDAVVNGNPGLLLIVEKYPWGNTLDVTRGVEAALKEMQPGLPGIRFDTHVFRAANFIETSLHNLTVSLLIGALLVVLVLGALPLRVAHRADQRHVDSAVARRSRPRPQTHGARPST